MSKNYIDELYNEYNSEYEVCESRKCEVCVGTDCATYNHLRDFEKIMDDVINDMETSI